MITQKPCFSWTVIHLSICLWAGNWESTDLWIGCLNVLKNQWEHLLLCLSSNKLTSFMCGPSRSRLQYWHYLVIVGLASRANGIHRRLLTSDQSKMWLSVRLPCLRVYRCFNSYMYMCLKVTVFMLLVYMSPLLYLAVGRNDHWDRAWAHVCDL